MADTERDDDLTDPTDDDVSGALAELGAEGEPDAPSGAPVDDYEDVFAEDTGPPPDTSGPPRGPDGKFVKKDETTTEAPATAGASASPDVPTPEPAAAPADPFAGWQAFTFKADGIEATIPGIVANETHVVIPRAVWDQEFRPKHLANREAWQQERGQWQERVGRAEAYARQVEQQRSEREQRADAMLAEFQGLIADPAKLQTFLEDFERQAPILQAQIEAQAARAEAMQYRNAQEQARRDAEYQQLFTQGTDAFEQTAIDLLKDPKYAGLVANDDERDELLAEIWEAGGAQMVLIPDRDYPELGYRRGVPVTDSARLAEIFDRKAAFLARRHAKWQQTVQTETRNAAAVASPATSPRTAQPSTPRKPQSAPHARPKAPAPPVSRRITDEDKDAWRDSYAELLDG